MEYKSGQIVEGKVTGIQPYGAFVALDNHSSGLIHISEISDGFVKDVNRFVEIGEIVKVKVIDYDARTRQAKLSLKAIQRTHARARRRSVSQKASLPTMRIGFTSIAQNMNQWIQQAKEDILK